MLQNKLLLMKITIKAGVTLITNDSWLRDKSDDAETFITGTKNQGVNNHFGDSISISKFPGFSVFPSILMFNPTSHGLIIFVASYGKKLDGNPAFNQ